MLSFPNDGLRFVLLFSLTDFRNVSSVSHNVSRVSVMDVLHHSRELVLVTRNLFKPCFPFMVCLVVACSTWKRPERSLGALSSKCYQVDDRVRRAEHAGCPSMRTRVQILSIHMDRVVWPYAPANQCWAWGDSLSQ